MISRLVGLCLAVFYALNSQAQQTKPLIASGHPEYPPFMWLENDRIIGAGPEIANRIFAELAIEVDFSSVGSWQRVLHRAEHGKVDFIVGAFKTPHRETFLSYTQIPFIEDPVVIFVNKGQAFHFTSGRI